MMIKSLKSVKAIRFITWPLTRLVVFYVAVIFLSNFIVDYPRLRLTIQIHNLNKVKPKSFRVMTNIIHGPWPVKQEEMVSCLFFYHYVVDYFPKSSDAVGMKGFCYYHLGMIKLAIDQYLQAIKLEPGYFWFHYNLGVIYFKQGSYKEAADTLAKAVACAPQKALAFIAESRGVYRLVIDDDIPFGADTASRLKRGYSDAYELLVLSRYQLKDYQGMREAAAQALQTDVSQKVLFYYYAGAAAFELKKNNEALSYLQEGLKIQPDAGELHYYLGATLKDMGLFQAANDELGRATQLLNTGHSLNIDSSKIMPQIF